MKELNDYQKTIVATEAQDGRWSVFVGVYLGVVGVARTSADAAAGVENKSLAVTHSVQCGTEVLKFEDYVSGVGDVSSVKPAAPIGSDVFCRVTKIQTFGAKKSFKGGIHPLPVSAAPSKPARA